MSIISHSISINNAYNLKMFIFVENLICWYQLNVYICDVDVMG